MARFEITTENGRAKVFTPYNPDFIAAIKRIGGARWNGSEKCWTIPEAAIDEARASMESAYGHTDITPDETVDLKISFLEDFEGKSREDARFLGKVLAHPLGRDEGSRIGEDVSFIEKRPGSGGSKNNYIATIPAGATAIVRGVNKKVYEKEVLVGFQSFFDCSRWTMASIRPHTDYITVELVEKSSIDREKLMEERERLQKRLAEIEELLAQ